MKLVPFCTSPIYLNVELGTTRNDPSSLGALAQYVLVKDPIQIHQFGSIYYRVLLP